ncbi:MAG: peptidylprolyl isomerase [Gemmatimonadales bacterium]
MFALVITLSGCSGFQDLFSAHADVAAEVDGQELPAKRLADLVFGVGKGTRITRETAEFVANAWVDYSLVARAAADGKLPLDSASVAEAMWPELTELKGNHFHDTLMARRSALPPTAADSFYAEKDQRLFQHILFGVRSNAEATARTATRKKAEATLTRLKRGAGFGGVAARLSEDAGSKADSGFLPIGPRGRFVAAFDSAAWTLGPGEMTGLVQTPFGYHIIRRPPMTEVRERLTDHLVGRVGVRLDSIYMDSLATANDIEVLSSAPTAMRTAADDPERSTKSTTALVRFRGGELTVQDYLRWVRALPPQYGAQIRQANDSMLQQFARVLAQNMLLLREADSAGVRATPAEWDSLRIRFRAQIDTLLAEIGLDGPEVTDEKASASERQKVAALKLEGYFDRLISGTIRLRPLPSALATILRERTPHEVNDAGVNRAVELGLQLKARADSTARTSPVKPAPGPAPIPGGPPAAAPGAGGGAGADSGKP